MINKLFKGMPMSIKYLNVVPQLVIWTIDSKALETLKSAPEFESDENTQKFIDYLLMYQSLLTPNNPRYNTANKESETLKLLENVKALSLNITEHPELKAAAFNLQGLIEQNIIQDHQAAIKSFEEGLKLKENLEPSSIAGLYANLNNTYNNIKKYEEAISCGEQAILQIKNMDLSSPSSTDWEKHIAAAAYSYLAYSYRKSKIPLYVDTSIDTFLQARELWPESNVIANNTAIAFIKRYKAKDRDYNLKNLELAYTIFLDEHIWPSKDNDGKNICLYAYAKENNQFVSPYYLSETLIKMLAHYSADQEEYQRIKTLLDDSLNTAKEATEHYSGNYKNKAIARTDKLEGDRELVLGDIQRAEHNYNDAQKQRKLVKESQAKKDKFAAKIPQGDILRFFQPKMLPQILYREGLKDLLAEEKEQESIRRITPTLIPTY